MTDLRLELFVDDIERSAEFYTSVLGFEREDAGHDTYVPLRLGSARLSLNLTAHLPDDHPVKAASVERKGRGVEIVLDVEDLDAAISRVRGSGWPLTNGMEMRPWGTKDFRVVDPDGYYLRISCRV